MKLNFKQISTILAIILMLGMSIGVAMAECKTDNSFTQGDDINICTGDCKYQNVSDLTTYFDCDSTVNCFLTSYYPNNTLISAHQQMSFNGTVFNKSIGNLTTTGTYNHFIKCHNSNGEFEKWFTSTISSSSGTPTTASIQSGYGSYSNSISYNDYLACVRTLEFIKSKYSSGRINYDTNELMELMNTINNELSSDLNSETIIQYISNYNSKCRGYEELPAEIQIGILEEKIKPVEKPSFREKYKYDLIFIAIILLGIWIFETIKNKRKKE